MISDKDIIFGVTNTATLGFFESIDFEQTGDKLEVKDGDGSIIGIEYHGGVAVTQALRLGRGGRAWALLDAPGLAWLRDASYLLVVRSRGRLGWLARRLSRTERPG